jgi:hypothetical protein
MAELTRQEIVKIIASGRRPLRLRGVDLSHLDLSGSSPNSVLTGKAQFS